MCSSQCDAHGLDETTPTACYTGRSTWCVPVKRTTFNCANILASSAPVLSAKVAGTPRGVVAGVSCCCSAKSDAREVLADFAHLVFVRPVPLRQLCMADQGGARAVGAFMQAFGGQRS